MKKEKPTRKKAPYPLAFTHYIRNLIRFAAFHLYIGEYERTMHFMHKPKGDDPPGKETNADISVDDVYLRININFFPVILKRFQLKGYRDIAKVVTHELCHVLTKPLQALAQADAAPSALDVIRQTVERQTERINLVFFELLPKNWWEPRRLQELLDENHFPPLED